MLNHLTMTEEEYETWCQPEVRSEYVDGKVIIMSPDSVLSEQVQTFLKTLLHLYVRHHQLGQVFGPNLEMRPRAGLRRVPDILFVAAARVGELTDKRLESAADLAVEVTSDDSVRRDWRDKLQEYEVEGVREYWIVDPRTRRLAAYARNEAKFEPVALDHGVLRSRAVPGFWIREEWLWQNPLPNELDILREMGII